MLTVVLLGVGRNLNRAARTCHSFGVDRLVAVDCPGAISGGLYSATGKVEVSRPDAVPDMRLGVAAEVDGDVDAGDLDWSRVDHLLLGGESMTLPHVDCLARVRIATPNPLCLTVEGALAALLAMRMHAARGWRKGWRYAGRGLYAGPLPRGRDVDWLASRGVRCVVDLTSRRRGAVERACAVRGVGYVKLPTGYDDVPDVAAVAGLPTPIAVHCFHGRDRAERFVDRWLSPEGGSS